MKASDIKYLVVHCSATPAKQDIGIVEIDRMHRERGFLKIGYHFVIRRNGKVEEGRKMYEVGAHAEGHNAESLGICLIGGVEKEDHVVRGEKGEIVTFKASNNFTPEQFAALKVQLKKLLAIPGMSAKVEVLGHRDLPNVHKDCPSFDVRSWWKDASK